jgi:pyridoxamine 5'-phosphate oxidase
MDSIRTLRKEYASSTLDVQDLSASPFSQLMLWLDQAIQSQVEEPHALTLSTVSAIGKPSGRVVLLRTITEDRLGFFTNYGSRKAEDMRENPNVALTFFWAPLERQVRIEGSVTLSDEATSDAYFLSRPRESRIGAWASPQSKPIPDRTALEQLLAQTAGMFESKEVHRPSFWGGYDVFPTRFEFWQGRPSRLHDRLVYMLSPTGWVVERLAP